MIRFLGYFSLYRFLCNRETSMFHKTQTQMKIIFQNMEVPSELNYKLFTDEIIETVIAVSQTILLHFQPIQSPLKCVRGILQ